MLAQGHPRTELMRQRLQDAGALPSEAEACVRLFRSTEEVRGAAPVEGGAREEEGERCSQATCMHAWP